MIRSLIAVACLSGSSPLTFADDWPEFLGPGGTARSSDVAPKAWDESQNVLWKADLPGTGSSSPIVVGDRLILTCYVADEPTAKRQVLCFDKVTGDRVWSLDFPIDYNEDRFQGYLTEHGYASNTPTSDGENVYVFFGKGGVHSIGLEGERNWSIDVGKESSDRQWGSAASLTLYRDRLIVNASEESQSLIALDKATGNELWKQEAGMLELAYGTPRLVNAGEDDAEIVLSVPGEIWAFNAGTGKLAWHCQSPMTGNVSPSVIVDGQTIYSFGGYRDSGSMAVRTGGEGDVTDSHVSWTNRSSSYVATPLLHEGRFYWIDDRGIAYCTSAADGSVIYRERVRDLKSGRPVYASPVLIGQHIYVVTRRSGTIVYPPGDAFQPDARNVFAGDETDFNASPAVSDNRLYLRSDRSIYCVAESR
ncbi:outer membrane protein assembly factor BamB family protein [Botrimarina hoheduenensis]|nr:PQQ-binding-like beta-propeller repeat protein [Botrimarina hoheduenensis]